MQTEVLYTSFALLCVGMLSEDPTVYLNPPASIFLMKGESAFLYFVYASNGDDIELVVTQMGFENEFLEDEPNLRAALKAVQEKSTITFHAQYFLGNSLRPYDPPVTRDTIVTVIGKCMGIIFFIAMNVHARYSLTLSTLKFYWRLYMHNVYKGILALLFYHMTQNESIKLCVGIALNGIILLYDKHYLKPFSLSRFSEYVSHLLY